MIKSGKKKKEEASVDLKLLERIQPRGGITFRDERYISKGTGFEACIRVYGYSENINRFWLTYLTNIPGTLVTIDITTEEIEKIKRNINRSIREQESRYMEAKDRYEKMKAYYEKEKYEQLLAEIIQMDEIVRLMEVRIFVVGESQEALDKGITKIISDLSGSGYKAAVFLNETQKEFESMFSSYSTRRIQDNSVYLRTPQPVLSSVLAEGNPFHFSSLSDPYGEYLGDTPVGGSVLFDPATIDKDRKYYNMAFFGAMGSGKSTTLKKLLKGQIIRGNYIRGFDVTGEFSQLIKYLGGKVISLDGTDGMLNPLEILRSGDNEAINWQNHISKVSTIYKYLMPGADKYEIAYFEILMRDFYQAYGLFPQNEMELQAETGVLTALGCDAYPMFSDFLAFAKEMKDQGMVKQENGLRHDNIILVITSLITNFGAIFNGRTTIKDILNEQLVYFNLSNIINVKAEIFDTVLFNTLSLCWDNLIQVGKPMKEQFDQKLIAWEDITRSFIIIDEAHRIVNTQKMAAVRQLITYEREARKYFGGLVLATQSIRDFVPEGSSESAINEIKVLFELTQYKFAMQQDNNVIPLLQKVFGGQMTDTLINKIPGLDKGEVILSLSNKQSIRFKIAISEEEKMLFAGGA